MSYYKGPKPKFKKQKYKALRQYRKMLILRKDIESNIF